ncbi:MAG TPA: YIP1 family protein [Thermoanaerobaculia bacterium]|nr:YIP1 family protein [Thermoanaerobaculia bacterium]
MNSHAESVPTPAAEGAGPSPAGTFLDTLFSPRAAFREIRRDPHWLLPLLFFTAATFVHTVVALPFTMARIADQIRSMNPSLNGAALDRAAETPRFMVGTVSLLSSVLTPLLIVLVTAGLAHLLAVLLKGDLDARGRAAFSASAHACLPLALGALARVPLILREKTLEVSLGLDAVMPGLAQGGSARFFQFFDGFRLWFAVLLAVAVAGIYRLPAWKAAVVSIAVNAVWFGFFVLMTGAWNL